MKRFEDGIPLPARNSIIEDLEEAIIEAKQGEKKFKGVPHRGAFTQTIKELRTIIKLVETNKYNKAYKLLDRLEKHVWNQYNTWRRLEDDTDTDLGWNHIAWIHNRIEAGMGRLIGFWSHEV